MVSTASSPNRGGPSSSPNRNCSPNRNRSPTFHQQTMSTTTIMELLINILTIMSFLFAAAPTLTLLQFEPIINHPCTTGSPTIIDPFTPTITQTITQTITTTMTSTAPYISFIGDKVSSILTRKDVKIIWDVFSGTGSIQRAVKPLGWDNSCVVIEFDINHKLQDANATAIKFNGIDTGKAGINVLKGIFGVDNNEYGFDNKIRNGMFDFYCFSKKILFVVLVEFLNFVHVNYYQDDRSLFVRLQNFH